MLLLLPPLFDPVSWTLDDLNLIRNGCLSSLSRPYRGLSGSQYTSHLKGEVWQLQLRIYTKLCALLLQAEAK